MKRTKKFSLFLVITLVTVFVFADTLPRHALGQVQPIIEIEEKLQGISDVEIKIMEELFTISQNIEELERHEAQTNQEIEILKSEIARLENEIAKKQTGHNEQLDVLERFLVGYQRKGPVSFLETALKSKNLTDFIQSLNMFRELSRNSALLLDELERSQKELALERENLTEYGKRLDESMAQLQLAIADMHRLKEEQESILDSLADSKELYQNELTNLQQMWDELKILFSEILVRFTSIFARGEFPVEALNLRLEFPRISGTIYAQTLNDVLEIQPEIPQMIFYFNPDEIIVEVPEKHLVLIGEFSITDKRILMFEVNKGSFFEMPLTESSINELFRNGPIVIDFKELMGDVVVESVEFFDGYLKFVIAPDF
jgi:peptidoglycan hydrolase CwlO-like protein